jgi:hypothetical protein
MARWRIRIVALTVAAGVSLTGCSDTTDGQAAGISLPTTTKATTTTSRPPFYGKTLTEGEVQKVSDLSGARMQPVTGGEVRGLHVAAKVLEFGTGDQIGSNGGGYQPPDGASLIAFRVSVTVDSSATSSLDSQVVASVSVDGKQRSLTDFLAPRSGTQTSSYLIAVPEERRAVDLELKSPGVVQQFDLLEGKPKGDRPAALYRAANGTAVFQQALTPSGYEVAPRAGKFSAVNTVTISQAEFGYFNGKTETAASTVDKAWLTFNGSNKAQNGESCVAPLAAHKLTDDKGTVYEAATSSDMPAHPDIIGESPFILTFEVPADMKKATLSVAPTTVTCQVSTANFQPVPARGEAKFDITIPEK